MTLLPSSSHPYLFSHLFACSCFFLIPLFIYFVLQHDLPFASPSLFLFLLLIVYFSSLTLLVINLLSSFYHEFASLFSLSFFLLMVHSSSLAFLVINFLSPFCHAPSLIIMCFLLFFLALSELHIPLFSLVCFLLFLLNSSF